MTTQEKKAQLRKYKMLATGLFVFMAVVFVSATLYQKTQSYAWIGYVKAFAEAAMVGALADWFAVTALFHYPLGLKIPHTNLIENSKERIGDNLGNFVVENFLSPKNIRPYLEKIKVSQFIGNWLSSPKNQENLINEVSKLALNIVQKLDDAFMISFIEKKAKEMANEIKINELVGKGIDYLLDQKDHQKLISNIAKQIKAYVIANENIVKDRVKKESHFLIPKFVDDGIAQKLTKGITNFFDEVEKNENHQVREEITKKLRSFSKEIATDPKWEDEFQNIKNSFLTPDKLHAYSTDIWFSIKKSLEAELLEESSPLKKYVKTNIGEWAINLQTDEGLQYNIDHWVRVTAYRYILKNTHQFGVLISSTVGNWQGKELSEKLELEVGKDLQFIRVNGTLVGGLVGLVIYAISQLL